MSIVKRFAIIIGALLLAQPSYSHIALATSIVLPQATADLSATAFPDNWPNTCPDPSVCAAGTYSGSLGPNNIVTQSYNPGTTDFGIPYPDGEATAAAFNTPAPGASVSATGDASATATVDYEFYIDGPSGTSVGITIAGSYSSNTCSGSFGCPAVASVTVLDYPSRQVYFTPAATPTTVACFSCTGIFSSDFNVQSDTTYIVELSASVGFAENANPFNGGYQPSLDPNLTPLNYISVDPVLSIDFAFTDQFTLVLSPNVGNSTTSVPEPSSLLIAAAAFLFSLSLGIFRIKQAENRA